MIRRRRRRRRRGVQAVVLDLVNEQRRHRGRRPLKPSRQLRLAARSRARDMAKRNYFSHVAPDGVPWWRRVEQFVGEWAWTTGENIAQNQDTPSEAVIDWMRSPTHRENILASKFTHMGLALARDGDREVWVQTFGGRR